MTDSKEDGHQSSDSKAPSDSENFHGEDRRQTGSERDGRRHDAGRRGTGRRRSLGEA